MEGLAQTRLEMMYNAGICSLTSDISMEVNSAPGGFTIDAFFPTTSLEVENRG